MFKARRRGGIRSEPAPDCGCQAFAGVLEISHLECHPVPSAKNFAGVRKAKSPLRLQKPRPSVRGLAPTGCHGERLSGGRETGPQDGDGDAEFASTKPWGFRILQRHALTLVTICFYIWDCQGSEYSSVTP
jgi:hypothetical protein